MKFLRKKRMPTRDEIRKAVPTPNQSADVNGAVISVPLAERRGFFGWLAKRTGAPNRAEIELDEIGLYVWSQIDGRRTVAGIAQALSKEYKLNKHEAEASLLEFIDRLRRRGCITLIKK
jgi:hypothetical protein